MINVKTIHRILIILFLLVPIFAQNHIWLDPEGNKLPFNRDEQVLEFLRSGEIIRTEEISEGTTGVLRLTLEKNNHRMRAVFRDVKVFKREVTFPDGRKQFGFKDDAIFEAAAYELSRILGIDNLPPTVVRTVNNKKGTLQVWIEKSITEKKRALEKIKLPKTSKIQMAHQTLRLFDNLIYNEDRNQGNILYDSDWNLWMIDHTRSFRNINKLYNPTVILKCDENLFTRLKTLNKEILQERLSAYLTQAEINNLLKRRDLLVNRINSMIEGRGEEKVFFNSASTY